MPMFDESYSMDFKSTDDFVSAAIEALTQIKKAEAEGNPYNYDDFNRMPYKLRRFIDDGESAKEIGSDWGLFVISFTNLSQKKGKGIMEDAISLKIEADILEPENYPVKKINLGQFYAEKIKNKKGAQFLCLFMKDKEGIPYNLIMHFALPAGAATDLQALQSAIAAKL